MDSILMEHNSKANEETKSIVAFAKKLSEENEKKWEKVMTDNKYDKLKSENIIITDLANGIVPKNRELLKLFCEQFHLNLEEAMKELKNIDLEFDLLGYISRDSYSVDDIMKRYLFVKDTTRTKFKRKDNHNLLEACDFTTDGVIKLNANEFEGHLTIGELGEMWARGEIGYHAEIQRGTKELARGDKAIFDQGKIGKIVTAIKEKTYISSNIYVCLYNDKKAKAPAYDVDSEELHFEGKKFVIEGQHRLHAFAEAWIEKMSGQEPSLDLKTQVTVRFMYFNDKQAKHAFSQLSEVKPISKARKIALSTDNISEMIKMINDDSEIEKQINMNGQSISEQQVVNISILYDSIEKNRENKKLDVSTDRMLRKEAEYLTNFIEELVNEFPKYFSNGDIKERARLRKISMLNQPIMWYALIDLAYYDRQNYVDNIKLLNKINFDKTNPVWRPMLKSGADEESLNILNDSTSRQKVVEILFSELYKVGLPIQAEELSKAE